MSDRKPLMPKATAVWLVENTALTFEQIADFCDLHVLEVKGIADGDVAQGIRGLDPITRGQLTREEIEAAEQDAGRKLRLAETKVVVPQVKRPRYTPVSRRHERPNAVLWLLRNHPELKDSQIMRLVGTTKQTIAQIRDRSHWNSANLSPADPVTLGICSQIDLDAEVKKAARRVERERKALGLDAEKAGTLLPTEETTAGRPMAQILGPKPAEEHIESEAEEQARVFARLKQMSGGRDAEEEADDEVADEEAEAAEDTGNVAESGEAEPADAGPDDAESEEGRQ
ncbi:MAG: DUF1013 domain-containing protein [Hyphomicrobiaceae bacterium]